MLGCDGAGARSQREPCDMLDCMVMYYTLDIASHVPTVEVLGGLSTAVPPSDRGPVALLLGYLRV